MTLKDSSHMNTIPSNKKLTQEEIWEGGIKNNKCIFNYG